MEKNYLSGKFLWTQVLYLDNLWILNGRSDTVHPGTSKIKFATIENKLINNQYYSKVILAIIKHWYVVYGLV